MDEDSDDMANIQLLAMGNLILPLKVAVKMRIKFVSNFCSNMG
jgi:hypothetical protein